MTAFEYSDLSFTPRSEILQVQRAAWQRISGPGSWWTGAERVAFAQLARAARAQRNNPPWLREALPAPSTPLPDAAIEASRRIAVDAHRLDRAWCHGVVSQLGDAAYVELAGVVAIVSAIDAFAEATGAAFERLPEPREGEPNRERPEGLHDIGAYVAMTDPWQGPNVSRALTLAPDEMSCFMGLVASMYAFTDFVKLIWDRPLTRPQIELVASRVSAVNECFY
jgi:hypothetical protein